MVFFNYALRKLNAKIVYYGPGLCGKTTNLQWIHDHFEGGQRGKMISLSTEGDRTIFFDLLPLDIGSIRGMDVTLQLYTVPGQVHYNSTRQLVLRGADGVVFVADSQRTMKSSNVESYENLQENLMLQGIDLKDFPHALQFNKRDLRDLLSTEDLDESVNVFSVPFFEAVATEGIGVQETLEGIVKLVMRNLREKYEPVASASGPHAPQPMQVTGPTAFRPSPKPEAPAPPPEVPDFAAMGKPPAQDGTRTAASASGATPFQDEDEIATKVYQEPAEETATPEPAFEAPEIGDKTPVFAPAIDATTAAVERVETEEPGGFSPDTSDDDAAGDDGVDVMPVADSSEPAVLDDTKSDPEIAAETPHPEIPEEGMEDLFEAEVPTVKAFVNNAIGYPEPGRESTGDSLKEPAPSLEEPTEVAAAPPPGDRYEDRIQAPGPFAPAPAADEPADSISASSADEDAVRAEVRQALGASEDREALASLSADADMRPDPVDVFTEEPAEVAPVVPPSPEEPIPADTAIGGEETTPPVVLADEPESPGGAEEEWDDDEEPTVVSGRAKSPFEAAPAGEPIFAEPEAGDVNFAVVAAEEPPAEEPVAEEPVPEEPAVEEPVVEKPVAPEPVMPSPPVAQDPLQKSQPIFIGTGDPFADDEVPTAAAEVIHRQDAQLVPAGGAVNVTAQDNQLHLQLKGSGAIAEMGQVRALDLEVPVPGQWVGNRKVTLQLRLTLTPAEDEDE